MGSSGGANVAVLFNGLSNVSQNGAKVSDKYRYTPQGSEQILIRSQNGFVGDVKNISIRKVLTAFDERGAKLSLTK